MALVATRPNMHSEILRDAAGLCCKSIDATVLLVGKGEIIAYNSLIYIVNVASKLR